MCKGIKKIFVLIYISFLALFILGCIGDSSNVVVLPGATFTSNFTPTNNVTSFNITATFQNNSIFEVSSITIVNDVFLGENLIERRTSTWDVQIGSNSSRELTLLFNVVGEADFIRRIDIFYVHNTFWQDYGTWLILLGSLSIFISLMLIVFKKNDGYGSSFHYFTYIRSIIFMVVMFAVTGILSFTQIFDWFSWLNWVIFVMLLSAIILTIILSLLGIQIKRAIIGISSKIKLKDSCDDIYEDELSGETFDEIEKEKVFLPDKNIKKIKLSDIAGLEDAKTTLHERVVLPLLHPEIYQKYGKSIGGGILLYGLPGTGKTMFAAAVATELDAKFFSIKCSDIASKWIGESESNIKALFDSARRYKRSVIFFDEFESLGRKRSETTTADVMTVQEILTQMQGVTENKNTLLVIAATNCPWAIDGALLRPGRFDELLYVPLPDITAREHILNINLKKLPLDSNIVIGNIAAAMDGYSGADVSAFCERLKMLIIRKEIDNKEKVEITQIDIDSALSNGRSSVLLDDIKRMDIFIQQHKN